MASRARVGLAIASLMGLGVAHAQGVQPGQLVTGWGDGDGIKRIDFNDISGGVNDGAGAVILAKTPLGAVQNVLVAGVVGGRRIGIAKLRANGTADTSFGVGGRAISIGGNVDQFAGMVRMPNGDLVIGYSDTHPNADDPVDFIVEVFDGNGQPRAIGGNLGAKRRGVDFSLAGQSFAGTGEPCNLFFEDAHATSLSITQQGNILMGGGSGRASTDRRVRRSLPSSRRTTCPCDLPGARASLVAMPAPVCSAKHSTSAPMRPDPRWMRSA
jgi:hypothetical protein